MEIIQNETLETQIFQKESVQLISCNLGNIDNQIKHCNNIICTSCTFTNPYNLEYCDEVVLDACFFLENSYKSIYNSKNITMRFSTVEQVDFFIDTTNIIVLNSIFNNSGKCLYRCTNVGLVDCMFYKCNNLGEHSKDMHANGCRYEGNQIFRFAENIILNGCYIDGESPLEYSKDVTLYNCKIIGENIGRYSKNLTLKNCTICGTNRFDGAENIKIIDCEYKEE